jgi:four helix bundle protein
MHDSLRTFEHHRLDAYAVALEALKGAEQIAKALPRGYGAMADQVRRASQSAFLQLAEGVARSGGERAMRLRGARAEASEAAAGIEGLLVVGVVEQGEAERVIALLGRLCAMLVRLERVRR